MRFGWGHHRVGIGRDDSLPNLALVGGLWDDCTASDGLVPDIKPQIGSSFVGIGAVASETILRQNRSDIAIVLDHPLGKRGRGKERDQ